MQYSATKNYRSFIQLCEQGRKCNVTGQYNALYYRRTKNDNSNDKILREKKFLADDCEIFDEKPDKVAYKDLQAGEGICAITMLKRKYQSQSNDFVSTADVAMLHSLRQVLASENANLLNDLSCLRIVLGESSPETIGQFWFEESYTKDYFQKQGKEPVFEEAKKRWNNINQYLKDEKIKPQKYYAVLTFDADDMGKTIGKLAEEKQKELSKALGTFADEMTKIVDDNHYGYTIYAGGDDYLGFLTLPTLFEALGKIRTKFDEIVGTEFNLKMSAGVAIAHYKTPLAETIAWSRRMEHEAKEADGKNAIGLAAVKKSGEIIKSVLKWKKNDVEITALLSKIYAHLNDNFSSKFIHVVHSEFEMFLNERIAEKIKSQIVAEVKRLLDRACLEQSDKVKKAKQINDFFENVNNLIEITTNTTLKEFIDTLSIIDFSTRKIEI